MESLILRVVPQALLFAYITKLLISGANLSDAIVIACMSGLCAVNQLLQDSKSKKELQEKLADLDKRDKELEQLVIQQNSAISDLKNYIIGAKLGTQLRAK